jgi:glycosyltransferase involved in cell wall biosynthesis
VSDRKPLRVLSVIGQLMVGGAETYLTRIAPRIRRYGVDMEICALDRIGLRLAELEQAGIVVHGTPFGRRVRQSNTVTLFQTIEQIRRIVRNGRFDIVHTYLFWSDILGVTGARLAGCRRIAVGRRALHSWIHDPKAIYHAAEQFTNSLANEVIANSQAVLRDAAASEALLPRTRTVIYNGIDVDSYTPSARESTGPLQLVTVGALSPRKGQEYAIEAMTLLAAAGVDARLVLVGAGPDEAMLRRSAAASGVEDRVTFPGEHPDPRPYLGAADAFVLPSRQEGFSNAILEAMACALPVIATDVGGNAEAVVDGQGGFIVPPQDPHALAKAIIELERDRNQLRAMGRFNRARVAERFSLEASARALADWYLHRGSVAVEPGGVGASALH